MKLNEKILFCRKRMGLSQEALAQQLNTSRQAVSRWELGDTQPELNNIIALAKLFGVTTDWLLMEDGSSDEPLPEGDHFSQGKKESDEETSDTWIDQLPGVIGRLFKRYGWMLGVYAAICGLMFMLFGGVSVSISTSMMHYSENRFDQMHAGFDWAVDDVVLYDESGEVMTDPALYKAFGFPVPSAVHQESFPNPVAALGTFAIVLGAMIAIGGTALAVFLKRRTAQSTRNP